MMRLAGATPAARSFAPTSCVKRRSTATRSTVAHATRAPLLSRTRARANSGSRVPSDGLNQKAYG